MSNLIPERRTDKNGVTSTRWVKPSGGTSQSLNAAPSPAGSRQTRRQKKAQRLFESIDVASRESPRYQERFKEQVESLPEPAIDLALKIIDENQDSPRVNTAVQHCINGYATANDEEAREGVLMQELRFAALESVYDRYLVKSPLGNPLRSHEVRDGIVHSTEVVLGTSKQGDYELTPAELDGAVLAGYAAAAVDMHRTNFSKERTNGSFYWSFLQDHGDLAGAFVEFRDRLEEAVAFVYENGDDAGALRQHMRGDHSALSGGAL